MHTPFVSPDLCRLGAAILASSAHKRDLHIPLCTLTHSGYCSLICNIPMQAILRNSSHSDEQDISAYPFFSLCTRHLPSSRVRR